MRESQIERYLVARVKALGGECRKVQWLGRSGAPDRLVMWDRSGGDFEYPAYVSCWVELKAPGKKPEHTSCASTSACVPWASASR